MKSEFFLQLKHNISEVKRELCQAALNAGRPEPKLVAVTKQVSADVVGQAISLGLNCFGENRVQEGLPKALSYPEAEWHFIGRLQTNKVKSVIGNFSLIQSLDRWNLAEALQLEAERLDVRVKALVQVNIAGETQKGGLIPSELDEFLYAVSKLSHLYIEGLMTVPPFSENPEDVRPYFRSMKKIFSACQVPGKNIKMHYLSMGMSGDYRIAVEEGSNMVRIGNGIFGVRN